MLCADDIAKQLMEDDLIIREQLVTSFGAATFENGTLNKAYLANLIFDSPENIKLINSIVHPATIAHSKNLLDKYLLTEKIVFYESALVFEAGMALLFDYIVLVTAPEELRIKRILRRDNSMEDSVRARINNQMNESVKMSKADCVIYNIGTIHDLKTEADRLLNNILAN